jgi:hypothetical protein
MINELFGYFLYGNLIFAGFIYYYLFQIRSLIGFQLGMNIAIMAGGFLAISTGIILIYQFPFHFAWITIITTVVGLITGILFGALFDYQTMLTGYANGIMMGIMSPMVGAAAKNSMEFLYFVEGMFVLSFIIMVSSAKYS